MLKGSSGKALLHQLRERPGRVKRSLDKRWSQERTVGYDKVLLGALQLERRQ